MLTFAPCPCHLYIPASVRVCVCACVRVCWRVCACVRACDIRSPRRVHRLFSHDRQREQTSAAARQQRALLLPTSTPVAVLSRYQLRPAGAASPVCHCRFALSLPLSRALSLLHSCALLVPPSPSLPLTITCARTDKLILEQPRLGPRPTSSVLPRARGLWARGRVQAQQLTTRVTAA